MPGAVHRDAQRERRSFRKEPDLIAYTSTPPFDPEKYRGFLEDTELSHEQQTEYLKLLWSIMITFVELGFGVDSVQQVLPALEEKDLAPPAREPL
jgi:hypothetical protein